MNDAESTEPVSSYPERFSDWVDQERQKDPDNLCDPPIEYDLALNYLFKYLIEDDWYITIPESPKQYTTAAVWHILERFSLKFRQELKEKKRATRIRNQLEYKTRVLNRRYERKLQRQREPNPFKRFMLYICDTFIDP